MRVTLVADGTSDQSLIPIIEWALWQAGVQSDLESTWADFRGLHDKPTTLPNRIAKAFELYPCDLLFVHRDAEAEIPSVRVLEIEASFLSLANIAHVPIVPVRMLESWLLLDEGAIRSAAGNPNGSIPLSFPDADKIEGLADPKNEVFSLLRKASEKYGRRLAAFHVESARTIISQYMANFDSLRSLASFRHFEEVLGQVVKTHRFDTWT